MQLDNLKKIVSNAWKVPNYDSFYKKGQAPKIIKSLKDLEKFPILNRDIYFDLNKKNDLSIGKNAFILKVMVAASGEETIFPLSAGDYKNCLNFEKRKFELIGVKKTDLCSIIEFPQENTTVWSQALLALGASCITLDGDEIKIFNDIARYKVSVIFTSPLALYRLLKYVKARNLKTSLRLVITTGVKIPDVEKLNEETKTVLGAELIDSIGSTELASFAISCKKHRNFYHFIDSDQIVEIVDPLTGKSAKEGEIVITPLWKVDFPLIRYGTSDFTKLESNLSCDCKIKNKTFFSGIEKRIRQSTRIQRYFVDLNEFYYKVRDSLFWQNFFDKRLWSFVEKPALAILITRVKHNDLVLVFIERFKFLLTLRRRQLIEDTIFKMTGAEVELIFCSKKAIQKVFPKHQDIRYIPKKNLSKEVLDLLELS